ncbi:MAG: glycoside hydrolase family 52 protein [Phycisphaeraceae bacterium]|nr:glycoside hydrolase family 52 protein [Phycisphaeraceae bacterium]
MQLMSWIMSRLGSRFSLLFEPYHRRVTHSALGRFLDEPLDLMVGLVEPDGTRRVMPFSAQGKEFNHLEQNERHNSITFGGASDRFGLRFEFNVHSVFYPQDETICTLPAFFLEMRVTSSPAVHGIEPIGPTPEHVELFVRIDRPNTQIDVAVDDGRGRIDLSYHNRIEARTDHLRDGENAIAVGDDDGGTVAVRERLVSLNHGCRLDADGKGLMLTLPVTAPGSGIKWRLVWGAHCAEPVLHVAGKYVADGQADDATLPATLRYARHYPDIGAVITHAIDQRDDYLAHSRNFEKLLDQSPLRMGQRHLIHQSFQTYLSNTYWCDVPAPGDDDGVVQWFSVREGGRFAHCPVDSQYNASPLWLSVWPDLVALQLRQWSRNMCEHKPSGGATLCRDFGAGVCLTRPAAHHEMPVELGADFLILAQAHAHWTGDLSIAHDLADAIESLAKYLLWSDREGCGYPTEGIANMYEDATPAAQFARRQTYLGVKRAAGLRAAGDLLERTQRTQLATRCDQTAERDASTIDDDAWIDDHYAVCTDKSCIGLVDIWSGAFLTEDEVAGWDGYSIHTGDALVLPAMIGQPPLLDPEHLRLDVVSSQRETLTNYGCGHSSGEPVTVWVSQNVWRDLLATYLGLVRPHLTQRYWDLQLMNNTHHLSMGYTDTRAVSGRSFDPRGVASVGFIAAGPRLVIDRLASGGPRITVNPDRHTPQRWPLLPLADWKAAKVPILVVDAHSQVTIECEMDPVIVHGQEQVEMIG